MMVPYRIGHGYDVHRLVEGRRLIVGGVDIPHSMGLLGHSDADVLLHQFGRNPLVVAVGQQNQQFVDFVDDAREVVAQKIG